jgi:hypothetical protein
MAATCDPLGVSAAIAKVLTTQAGLPDASIEVTDVLVETQLAASSPNVLTVSIADPLLLSATSGLLTARKAPRLDKRKGLAIGTGSAAFPVVDLTLDGSVYRLTDIEGTTDLTQPNLTLEFQSRGACLLRQHLGPLKAIREASMTRAEFIAAVVARVRQYGGVPFFCPLLEVIQPVGQARTEHSGKRVTYESSSEGQETLTLSEMERMLKLAQGNKQHEGNVSLSGAHTRTSAPEIKSSSSEEGDEGDNGVDPSLNPEQTHNARVIMEVARKVLATTDSSGEEETAQPARAALVALAAMETALTESDLENKEQVDGTAQGVFQMEPTTSAAAGVKPYDVAAAAKWFLEAAKQAVAKTPNAQAYEIAQAVQRSGAGKASNGAGTYGKQKANAEAIIKDFGGVGAHASSEKPYEYAINSEENFWQGINKVASEVQWYLWFGDGDTLYYQNSLELIKREPMAYIDPIRGVIESDIYINQKTGARVKGKRTKKYTSRCGLFKYDINVGSEGSSTKGGLTTECTLQIFCQPNFIRAGDVVILTDPNRRSPWYRNGYRGRWVVINATRSIFNAYTEVTLAIPGTVELLVPVAEPEAQSETSKEESEGTVSVGGAGVVEAARRALQKQKDNPGTYEYSETRPMPESLFSGELPIRIDCSGFATLCCKAADLPDPNGLGYNGSGFTRTLEAHGHATSNPQPGDLAFWSGPDHVAVYIGGGKVIEMGGPGDPVELTVASESAFHTSFVGYRSYTTTSASTAQSATKAASDNVLHAVGRRTTTMDLRKPFWEARDQQDRAEADLLDGGIWDTGR